MPSFLLKPRARKDLEGIWFYTLENWGESQADSYIHDLNEAFKGLAKNPEKGRLCEDIRKGYRKYLIGKHVFFYWEIDKGIEVVRILHQNMDIDKHFGQNA
jgi:toxin ParE1/3/4